MGAGSWMHQLRVQSKTMAENSVFDQLEGLVTQIEYTKAEAETVRLILPLSICPSRKATLDCAAHSVQWQLCHPYRASCLRSLTPQLTPLPQSTC